VPVLNECASVAARPLGRSYPEIREGLEPVRAGCAVVPLTLETHDLGLHRAERYGFAIYDALIVVAARGAGGRTLDAEALQDGQTLDGQRTVRHPGAPWAGGSEAL
jgi:predicted nucleic acid-binding protein